MQCTPEGRLLHDNVPTPSIAATPDIFGLLYSRKKSVVVDYAVDTWRGDLLDEQGTPKLVNLDLATLNNIISQ
jgi:hypothetical protein